jgi:hypothetical protein
MTLSLPVGTLPRHASLVQNNDEGERLLFAPEDAALLKSATELLRGFRVESEPIFHHNVGNKRNRSIDDGQLG